MLSATGWTSRLHHRRCNKLMTYRRLITNTVAGDGCRLPQDRFRHDSEPCVTAEQPRPARASNHRENAALCSKIISCLPPGNGSAGRNIAMALERDRTPAYWVGAAQSRPVCDASAEVVTAAPPMMVESTSTVAWIDGVVSSLCVRFIDPAAPETVVCRDGRTPSGELCPLESETMIPCAFCRSVCHILYHHNLCVDSAQSPDQPS